MLDIDPDGDERLPFVGDGVELSFGAAAREMSGIRSAVGELD